MCGGGDKPKAKKRAPAPVQPPAQPPSVKATAAEVNIGSKDETGTKKRKKVGRSQLRQKATGSNSSGLGS